MKRKKSQFSLLLFLLLLLYCYSSLTIAANADDFDSVLWVVQLSDLHISVHHPQRAHDFKEFLPPALSIINPSLVFITGDLTDGKSKDMLVMKQDEEEWIEYEEVTEYVIEKSGLDRNIFYDLRGNHDSFGVPVVGGPFDFFSRYSINGRLERKGNVHSITVERGGRKHLFVGIDSTMATGLRGPTNLFGHPTDQLLSDMDTELSQWDTESTNQVTKIVFGHFPLSFTAATESGNTLRDVFLKHSISAYLCGHLHAKFGKNLKRHHQTGPWFSLEKYFQWNIHQTSPQHDVNKEKCHHSDPPIKDFWEWEMGDWRSNRLMRVLAIDSGHVSFVDVDLRLEDKKTMIILPTFPLDSRVMLKSSDFHEYNCRVPSTLSYKSIRALVFSKSKVNSVVARIYDTGFGNLDLVFEETMRRIDNSSDSVLYAIPWNWKAFEDPSPERYWIKIEATDIRGRVSTSELRPFSIIGVSVSLSWTWKEFIVMGFQWDAVYYPFMWSIILFLFSTLVIPKVLLMCSKKPYSYRDFSSKKGFIRGLLWGVTQISVIFPVWLGMFIYLVYLISFPWFVGQVFTEGVNWGYMSYKGWTLPKSKSLKGKEQAYIGYPDIMVVVLPHLCFVIFPAIMVIGALAAEREVSRQYHLSLSGKKDDEYDYNYKSKKGSKLLGGMRLVRKFLIFICLILWWKHWKNSKALMKAYEMNPILHFPVYCFSIPVLLMYSIYSTTGI
ncbi:hypothetical protein ACHQM5_028208 [Ranunculus cassubicifolius]